MRDETEGLIRDEAPGNRSRAEQRRAGTGEGRRASVCGEPAGRPRLISNVASLYLLRRSSTLTEPNHSPATPTVPSPALPPPWPRLPVIPHFRPCACQDYF